jgi:hypothetical protein
MTTIQAQFAGAALSGAATALGEELGIFSGLMSVALGQMVAGGFQPSTPAFTAAMPASGQADVDLGDGNTLRFDKSNSQMQIIDGQGNVTTVYGDPHLLENGTNVGQFSGPMTFQLTDGTKITVDTRAGTEGTGVTYADQVTITRGSNAVVVSGLDQQSASSLQVSTSQNGYALDRSTFDGLRVEQGAGGQWTSSLSGQAVTQSDLDLTKPAGEGAILFGQAFGQMLGGFLANGLAGGGAPVGGQAHHARAAHGGGQDALAMMAFGLGFAAGAELGAA